MNYYFTFPGRSTTMIEAMSRDTAISLLNKYFGKGWYFVEETNIKRKITTDNGAFYIEGRDE